MLDLSRGDPCQVMASLWNILQFPCHYYHVCFPVQLFCSPRQGQQLSPSVSNHPRGLGAGSDPGRFWWADWQSPTGSLNPKLEPFHPYTAAPGDAGAGGSTGLQRSKQQVSWLQSNIASYHIKTITSKMCWSCTSSLGSTGESVIGKLFGCEVENSSLCRCGKETVRSSLTLLFTMHYPEESSQGETTAGLKPQNATQERLHLQ